MEPSPLQLLLHVILYLMQTGSCGFLNHDIYCAFNANFCNHFCYICFLYVCTYTVHARSESVAVQTDHQSSHEHDRTQAMHLDQHLRM